MERYAIFKIPDAPARARRRGLEAAAPPAPQVAFQEMSAKDVADGQRGGSILAPIMPTILIEPMEAPGGDGGGAGEASWGIAAVGADRSPYSGKDVTVAVLDTGIDHKHPAFEGVAFVEQDFSGDGNGDRKGHGTHCAGTIFGRDVDGRIGIARGVTRALIGKVLRDDGKGNSEMVFSAMQWALQQRADVISMSLGFDFTGLVDSKVGAGWPPALATSVALEAYRGNLRMFDAIMAMLKSSAMLGVSPIVVAASGNQSRRLQKADYRIGASLPAAAQDVVSVGAVSREGEAFRIAEFSNIWPVVSGPGVDIRSAWPGGGFKAISGTSMACPHVAGVAALWWEALRSTGRKPDAAAIAARLRANARKDGLGPAYDSSDFGEGLVTAPLKAPD